MAAFLVKPAYRLQRFRKQCDLVLKGRGLKPRRKARHLTPPRGLQPAGEAVHTIS